MSKDGNLRQNMNFSRRYTKQELQDLDTKAKGLGYKNFRNFVECQLSNIEMQLDDLYNEAERHDLLVTS